MTTNNSSEDDWDIVPVKERKPIDYDRCQQMYWNLLLKLDENRQIEPATFVALLAGTQRCDTVATNLQHLRKGYHDTMEDWKEGSYRAVLKDLANCSDSDKEAAYRT